MNGLVVVDASLAVKWLVEEIHTRRAVTLVHNWRLDGVRVIAPFLMAAEVTNALYRKALRREISMDAATRLLNDFWGVGVVFREPRGPAFPGLGARRSP